MPEPDPEPVDLLGLTSAELARVEALIALLRMSRMTLGQVASLLLNALPPESVRDRDSEGLADYVAAAWNRVARGE